MSETVRSALTARNIGAQRVFEIGLHALKLSSHCPLSHTCIYLTKTEQTFPARSLPCEQGHQGNAHKPIGWQVCPVRKAFHQKEISVLQRDPERSMIEQNDWSEETAYIF